MLRTLLLQLAHRQHFCSLPTKMDPVIVIHGGSGDISDQSAAGKLQGVSKAIVAGSKLLLAGASAMDAAIAAVKVMEDDPFFNAGKGSVLNLHGEVEMDAIVMDGATLKTGSVTGVKGIEHPVELARLVMEKTPHAMLSGEGANLFALKENIPRLPAYHLVTQASIDALEAFLHEGGGPISETNVGFGTVGAVALDSYGNLAAVTSTGGTTGKYVGRVGDTPIPGSGGYADNEIGAVSATGEGEGIMRVCLSHKILTLMENGLSADDATMKALKHMEMKLGALGGAITLSKTGEIAINFTSDRMAWAFQRGNAPFECGVDSPPDLKTLN